MKSAEGLLHFAEFTLDPANRSLLRGDVPVDLGSRYFDALVMLAAAPGELISKNRLHEEVWRGVPVTDEALSQAIMALRRALGDDAARPRFIETVPRHGYRFIAAVESAPHAMQSPKVVEGATTRLIAGGLAGAAAAGLTVGLVYGVLAAPAGGALSLVLVLVGVSILAALVSGIGIAGAIAIAERTRVRRVSILSASAALGGALVGGFARLLGIDSLRLLAGSAPERIAGAGEGLVAGAAVGLAYWLATRRAGTAGPLLRTVAGAGLGAVAGLVIVLAGGTLMAGSLASLVSGFPGASLDMFWAINPALLAGAGAFEGALFTALVAAGMAAAREREIGRFTRRRK